MDLANKKFGELTVIDKVCPQIGRTVKWNCICNCGNRTIVRQNNLVGGGTKSCGQHVYNNLVGKKFHHLTVKNQGNGISYGSAKKISYICECDCGNIVEITAQSIVNGNTKSCGCFKKKRNIEVNFKGYKDITGEYWSNVKEGAKRRNLEFAITLTEVWELYEKQNRKCALSGVEIIFGPTGKNTASIDRIDNKRGYILDNIQILHKDINIMKNKFEQEYFIGVCQKISKNRESNK